MPSVPSPSSTPRFRMFSTGVTLNPLFMFDSGLVTIMELLSCNCASPVRVRWMPCAKSEPGPVMP
jgi:hypothetical protein